MVIAADGNTYLGKTTYLRSLADEYPEIFVLVEEYDTDLELLKRLPNHLDRQVYYFSLEEERVHRFGGVKNKSLLLDRSYLSILAHSWAMSHLERRQYYKHTLGLLYKQLEKGLVLVPDRYILFLQENENLTYSDCLNKGSEEILYDTRYRSFINSFFTLLNPALENGFCPLGRMLTQLDCLNSELEYCDD